MNEVSGESTENLGVFEISSIQVELPGSMRWAPVLSYGGGEFHERHFLTA